MEKVFTPDAPAAIGPYTQAIVANGFVFTSGQIPLDPATGKIVEGGIKEQTKRICENLKAVLEQAGSSLQLVVKTTCFLADMSDFVPFNEIYGEYFTEKPARSCVAVKTLPKNVLAEVEVVALLAPKKQLM